MQSKKKTGVGRLLEFAGAHRPLVGVSGVFSALSAVLMLSPFVCVYFALQEALAALVSNTPLVATKLTYYGWLAVLLALGALLLYFASLMCSHLAAFYTMRNMQVSLMRHLVKLPLGYFSNTTTGRLRKIIDENTAQTETFIAHQIPDLIGSFITPFAILGMLFVFDWRLGLLSLVPLIIGFVIEMRMMNQENSGFLKKYQNSLEDMNREAVEYVRGISVVKVFSQTVHSFKNFYASIMSYNKYVSAYTLSWRTPMTLFTAAIHGTFFLLIPAGILLLNGAADTGSYLNVLLSVIFYILFTPACAVMLNKMMYAGSYLMIANECVNRIDSLLDEKPLSHPEHPKSPKDASVEFSRVSFTYPGGGVPAIKNLSFSVKEGQTVALVGPSGGGKTTAVHMIPRFYDVDSGAVLIGGVDVRDIAHKTLMDTVSFAFQNTRLFKASLMDNIRAARPEATRAEALRAAEAAQCMDIFEKLPHGIDTVVGTKGVYLSGGEVQRIALARTILKDSPIIVLDEATAFADPENEVKIQQAFEALTKGKTVLLIAHRLSTVRHADQILVLREGELVEQGTHDGLLKQEGMYAAMWKEYERAAAWGVGKENSHVS